MSAKPKLQRFNENVLSKYQIYNGIFTSLPFDEVSNTGALLPLFMETCQKGYAEKQNPEKIVEGFFKQYLEQYSTEQQLNLLFRFIQYIERQVVLFDAIEDASFPIVNNMDGRGTMRNIREEARDKNKKKELKKYLEECGIRIVLTAHPTQFYPGTVLGIINDLAEAIREDDLLVIKGLLAQLGKTPFFNQEKPTPLDEAVSLIWYLENVFYHSAGAIYSDIRENIFNTTRAAHADSNKVIALGFWPGGDRDGNPFVTTEITLQTAEKLREAVIKNYFRDFRDIKRRLTYAGLEQPLKTVEGMLNDLVFNSANSTVTLVELEATLQTIRNILIDKHQSLYLEVLDNLINKVSLFGFHFATLDIRQDSRVHHAVFREIVKHCQDKGMRVFPDNYFELTTAEQNSLLLTVEAKLKSGEFTEERTAQTLGSIEAMRSIQARNGERGCNRYIISNCGSVQNILEVYAMLRLTGWQAPSADIIPLFETVPDLKVAHEVMESLYTDPVYAEHLARRGNTQTIMLGFSDGTKDGGYLMANWSIYKAKEALTAVSRKHNIDVIFFDGRGGPPARGGGNTHQFYASQGPTIENIESQLTIQGQTISSNFGTLDSCQYNLEQLLSSGISNEVFSDSDSLLSQADRATMQELADLSYQAYTEFKQHPRFIGYLEYMSTLKYYAKTNIGSRPSKRGQSSELNFDDLRAIPFVGSWSQLKQNVPGFYGVGTALKYYEEKDRFEQVQSLYQHSSFFRTLIGNSMMSLSKSFFGLTAYMQNDPEYGEFWQQIHNEYLDTRRLLLKLTGFSELMENEAAGKASIAAREMIVLPLLTIQQFALMRIRQIENDNADEKDMERYQKMVTRSLFGNINASRNSA